MSGSPSPFPLASRHRTASTAEPSPPASHALTGVWCAVSALPEAPSIAPGAGVFPLLPTRCPLSSLSAENHTTRVSAQTCVFLEEGIETYLFAPLCDVLTPGAPVRGPWAPVAGVPPSGLWQELGSGLLSPLHASQPLWSRLGSDQARQSLGLFLMCTDALSASLFRRSSKGLLD